MARFFLCIFTLIAAAFPVVGRAVPLLYDAETLNWLEDMAAPLLKEAGIAEGEVSIRLIQDNSINAFVTPDRSLYMNTGLILKAEHPGEVLGVLAHEIGHIKGQHTSRIQDNLAQQKIPIVLGGLVGLGAALAGSGDGALAAMSSGTAAAQANLLYASRGYEEAADQVALQLLEKTGEPVTPLIDFLSRLQGYELLYSRVPPPYLSSHPLTPERLNTARHSVEGKAQPASSLSEEKFQWIQAKIHAITETPGTTLRLYSTKSGDSATLARAIAYARQGKRDESLKLVEDLSQSRKKDPYLYELKGHIALDHGRLDEAVTAFNKAVNLRPQNSLLRYQYGVALRHAKNYTAAVKQLHRVRTDKPEWIGTYRELGLAYGAADAFLPGHLFLAEAALLSGKELEVKQQLALAKPYLDKTTEQWRAYYENLSTRLADKEK